MKWIRVDFVKGCVMERGIVVMDGGDVALTEAENAGNHQHQRGRMGGSSLWTNKEAREARSIVRYNAHHNDEGSPHPTSSGPPPRQSPNASRRYSTFQISCLFIHICLLEIQISCDIFLSTLRGQNYTKHNGKGERIEILNCSVCTHQYGTSKKDDV